MTVPVPLTDIEARPLYYSDYDGSPWVKLPLAERDALCEALRTAVEGLSTVQNGQRCEKVVPYAAESSTCIHQERMSRDSLYTDARWCDTCITRAALAAVRELVDLGGDDG